MSLIIFGLFLLNQFPSIGSLNVLESMIQTNLLLWCSLVEFLASRWLGLSEVPNYGVNFSQSEINSPCEVILVINLYPSGDVLNDISFQDSRHEMIFEIFVLQDGEVFLSFWLFSESSAIRSS
jgi:hypothetical protein